MTLVVLIATTLLVLRATHSYVLVSANLDDVKAIFKQIARSPVMEQIDKIVRRHFNVQRKQAYEPEAEDDYRRKSRGYHYRRADDAEVGKIKDSNTAEKKENHQLYVSTGTPIEKTNETAKNEDSVQDGDVSKSTLKDLAALGQNAANYLKSVSQTFKDA